MIQNRASEAPAMYMVRMNPIIPLDYSLYWVKKWNHPIIQGYQGDRLGYLKIL